MQIDSPILLKRSSTLSKRPAVGDLEVGQPAVNTNLNEPGLFLLDSTSSDIIKIGPCYVGSSPPNSTPAPGGSSGNSKGEFWLDDSDPYAPILKVWKGSSWVSFGYVPSNTLWVNPYGDDNNSGNLPQLPKQTIEAALAIASPGTVIQVAPGTYNENNPLVFPEENVLIIGSGQSGCTIIPQNPNQDLFHVVSGCCVDGFSFSGAASTGSAIMAFIPSGSGIIVKSPSLRNCNNSIGNTVGALADGTLASGDRSISVQSLYMDSDGGVGVKATNKGVVIAEGCTTVYAEKAAFADNGGTIQLTGCKSVYGQYGLYSEGKSAQEQSGTIVIAGTTEKSLNLTGLTTPLRPYEGQILSVGTLYYKVGGFNIVDQGLGYTSAPQVEISSGSGPGAITPRGRAIIKDGKLTEIEIIDPGNGIAAGDTITVTLTGGNPTSPASATVVKEAIYYTVQRSTEIVSGSCTVELIEEMPYLPPSGASVKLYQPSRISAVSHMMEYVGCGSLSPYQGGVSIPGNQTVCKDGAKLFFTSLNQSGIFSVGQGFIVNQGTGEVYGGGFERSVLNISLPLSLT